MSGWEDYSGAAVGGAVTGEVLLYTANPVAAGAAGGFFGNLTSQVAKLSTGKQCSFSVASLGASAGLGALTGFIPGKIGSKATLFKQMTTKFRRGQIKNLKGKTAIKMFREAMPYYAMPEGAFAGAAGGQTIAPLFNN